MPLQPIMLHGKGTFQKYSGLLLYSMRYALDPPAQIHTRFSWKSLNLGRPHISFFSTMFGGIQLYPTPVQHSVVDKQWKTLQSLTIRKHEVDIVV